MGSWKFPGKPYEIELDGLTIKCMPMSRGRRKEIFAGLDSFGNAETSEDKAAEVDALYDLAIEIVSGVDGIKDVAEFLDHQGIQQIITLLVAATQGGSISDGEKKNSESSSDA